jgi:TnpA family transposase
MAKTPARSRSVPPAKPVKRPRGRPPRLGGPTPQAEIQPGTLHAGTQGQSEPVFGLCRLLGIKLMPRARGISDVIFYRPTKSIHYEHIDALFTGDVDWDLIATHAQDMIQVVLSIQAVAP